MDGRTMRPKKQRREPNVKSVCCSKPQLLLDTTNDSSYHLIDRYHSLMRKIRYNRNFIAINPALAILIGASLMLTIPSSGLCLSQSVVLESQPQIYNSQHLVAQARVGGLDPNDYIDEAGELDVMANQQQIPTAQLMAAAGHIVPENFFLPGGSIPALHPRYHHHQQQQQLHQQPQQYQQAESTVQQQVLAVQQARHLLPGAMKYLRQVDLLAAASGVEPQANDQSSLIDINGYNLVAQPDGRDSSALAGPVDLVDILAPAGSSQALYEQQQHYAAAAEQHMAELAAMSNQQQHQQHPQHQNQQSSSDNAAQASENYGSSIGPAYQIAGQQDGYAMAGYGGDNKQEQQQQKPYGLPTKSSNKEPSGMLKPLGNPKTVSSPVIDFVANQLPKTTNLEKLADKLPQTQTPTVFSFSSSKDPMEKVKGFNQKKRGVMRQAEQLARMMIKSVNDKFGTTIGDNTDIPFLLSSFGPLGFAQNVLTDPTLLVTLLNSAEKTYFSDVLPGPAKMAMRPVLNIFRVPNKKRDKANLLNIISYLASGGQTPSNSSAKHRQGFGIEKQAKKNKQE